MDKDNKLLEGKEGISPAEENQILKAQLAGFEESSREYEKSVQENTDRLYAEIATRKHAEEALLTSHLQLSEAMDLARIVYWSFDPSSRMLELNDAFYKFNGTTAEIEGGYHIPMEEYTRRFIHPDDLHIFYRHKERMDSNPDSYIPPDLEHRIVCRDGKVRHIINRTRIVRDAEGRVIRVFGANQDITERKKMEEDLSRSVSLLNATIESTADGIIVVDQTDRMVMFNKKFIEMWRIPNYVTEAKDDNLALDFVVQQLINPDEFIAKVKELHGKPDLESFDVLYFKDGRIFERYSRPQRVGNQIAGRVWSFRDVTEQKQMERALRVSEEKFRAMVETTSDFLWECDINGIYTYASPRIKNILGYEPAEIIGKNIMDFISPEDEKRVAVRILEHTKVAMPFEVEDAHVHKDGRRVMFETKAVPIIDAKGQLAGYRGIGRDITRRKKAEEALKETAHFLQTIIDAIPNPIFFKDTNFIYQGCNKAFEDYMGISKDKIIGKSAYDIAPRELADRYRQMDEELFQQGGTQTYETFVRHADNTRHNVIFYKAVYSNPDGSINGLVGVILDITERRQAEEKIRLSERYFRSIIENISDTISIINSDGLIRYESPSIERVLGYKPSEMIGQHIFDYIHPDDLTSLRERFEKDLARPGDIAPHEIRRRHKDGSWHVMEINGQNLLEDEAVKGMLINARDITERRKTEELLRQSEERYRLMAETAHDTIWTIDLAGNMTYISPSVKRLIGYTPEEGMQSGLKLMTPESIAIAGEDMRRMIGQFMAGSVPESRHLELEFIHKDGSTVWVEVTSNPMFDASGQLVSIQGVSRDITDRKKAREELQKLNDELEQKVEERTNQLIETQEELVRKEKLAVMGQLAGIVGHEIRNPLGVINNAAYFLKTILTDADDVVKEYLDIIKEEVANSQRIITDLLDFARTRPPHPQTIAAKTLIDQSMGKSLIPENIAIDIDIQETIPSLRIDPVQIEQVFQNLITNAVQAMPNGGALRVTARRVHGSPAFAESFGAAGLFTVHGYDEKSIEQGAPTSQSGIHSDSEFIEISVQDTGTGISPENMKKLFQPLFTTKAKGIGLGLVVCKNLVEVNGGSIMVESVLGTGTKFNIKLPIAGGDE